MGFIVLWIACAVIGGFIGGNRGRGGTGFILGLLFGPVGCFMILAMSGDRVNCPHCESKISPKATSCPKCTKDLIELDTNFSKENKNNQTESSYLKKLDNDLANLKISMTTYDLLKKKYLSEQKVEIESNEALTSDLDVEQRLNKLSLLKDKGLITDSEYNEKREEILKSL